MLCLFLTCKSDLRGLGAGARAGAVRRTGGHIGVAFSEVILVTPVIGHGDGRTVQRWDLRRD